MKETRSDTASEVLRYGTRDPERETGADLYLPGVQPSYVQSGYVVAR